MQETIPTSDLGDIRLSKPDPKNLIVPEGFQAKWDKDICEADYHADRTALSSTALRKAFKSSRAFHRYFVDGVGEVESPSMAFGTMAHTAILEGEKFFERYVIEPILEGFTKDGRPTTNPNATEVKNKRAQWLAELPAGVKIVTQEELDRLKWMIDAIVDHPIAFALLKDGLTEASGWYRDPRTGIRCRIRLDFLSFNLNTLVDVKTTQDCTEEAFMRSAFKNHLLYPVQMAMYDEAIFHITGKRPDHCAWIAIEPKAPFELAVHEVGPMTMQIGRYEYNRLMDRVKLGIDSGEWPGYQVIAGVAEPPNYIVQHYQLRGVL
jgi:hypothetical protein